MANPEHEIPEGWQDSLDELREHVRSFPEDEEDRWIREGQAIFARMTPEERAAAKVIEDEILEHMQTPGFQAAVDRMFEDNLFGETGSGSER